MILHVDSGKEWRGGQAQVLNLMRGLRSEAWEQCLICPPEAELGQKTAAEGMTVEHVPMSGEWDLRAPRLIAQIARKRQARLLHAHASQAHGLCWRALRRLPDVPLLVTRRVDFAISRNFLSRRKYLNSRTSFIAISRGVRDVLVAGGVPSGRVHIVHSGIDAARWNGEHTREELLREFNLPASTLVIVNVAALADHKGQRYLIDAAPMVIEAFPETRFFIVGEGELRKTLEEQIARLGLQDKVILTGFRNDVELFLTAADLFVLSSHLEGLCTSLLDAMWFSKPAVATSVGGVVDVIQHEKNGLLVEAKNPQALADSIMTCLKSVSLRERLGVEARRTVEERFSAQSTVQGTMQVYQRMLGD